MADVVHHLPLNLCVSAEEIKTGQSAGQVRVTVDMPYWFAVPHGHNDGGLRLTFDAKDRATAAFACRLVDTVFRAMLPVACLPGVVKFADPVDGFTPRSAVELLAISEGHTGGKEKSK